MGCDHIQNGPAIVVMGPMVGVGFYLGSDKIVGAYELYSGAVHLTVVINLAVGYPGADVL